MNINRADVSVLIRTLTLAAAIVAGGGCCIPQPPVWDVAFQGTGDNLLGDGQAHALDSRERPTSKIAGTGGFSFGSDLVDAPRANGETPVVVGPGAWGTAIVLFLRLPPGPLDRDVDVWLETGRGDVEAWFVRDVSGVSWMMGAPSHAAAPILSAANPADRGTLPGVYRMSGRVRYVAKAGRVTNAQVDLVSDANVPRFEEYVAELKRWHENFPDDTKCVEELKRWEALGDSAPRPARLSGRFTGHWVPWCRPWPFI